jgi:hypothetical protein
MLESTQAYTGSNQQGKTKANEATNKKRQRQMTTRVKSWRSPKKGEKKELLPL